MMRLLFALCFIICIVHRLDVYKVLIETLFTRF